MSEKPSRLRPYERPLINPYIAKYAGVLGVNPAQPSQPPIIPPRPAPEIPPNIELGQE